MPEAVQATRPVILVVEDEAPLLALVGEALHEAGFAVEAAASTAEVLLRADRPPPDLALLDVLMDGAWGSAVGRWLRQRYGPAVPIVVMSGNPALAERVGHGLAARAILPKPFRVAELVRTVQVALGPPGSEHEPPGEPETSAARVGGVSPPPDHRRVRCCPARLAALFAARALLPPLLARQAGVDVQTVQRSLEGQPVHWRTVTRLAAALGVDPAELVAPEEPA